MPNVYWRFSHPTGETGKTVDLVIVRLSDHACWDFASDSFKLSGWGTPVAEMDELTTGLTSPPAALDGEYIYEWAVPDERGCILYEALMSEDTSGERQRQVFCAVDGHIERNSQVEVELDPDLVTPYTLDHAALAAFVVALGDMSDVDTDSVIWKAPVNGKVFVEFARTHGPSGYSRERQ